MIAIILIVHLLFCKLYGTFVCPVFLVVLYFCRLYKIMPFLQVFGNLNSICVVLQVVVHPCCHLQWHVCLPVGPVLGWVGTRILNPWLESVISSLLVVSPVSAGIFRQQIAWSRLKKSFDLAFSPFSQLSHRSICKQEVCVFATHIEEWCIWHQKFKKHV